MGDRNESLGRLFSDLFYQLDFKDQVYILQTINEMLPKKDRERVVSIGEYMKLRDQGKER